MGWLAAIIGLIALVFFMIISPGFRYFIIALVALVVLGGLGIYGWIEHDNEKAQQANERNERQWQEKLAAARSAIALRDLALDKVQLKKEHGPLWTLTGNVTNNSKYSLSSLRFIVRIEDCPQKMDDWVTDPKGTAPKDPKGTVPKECITIGEAPTRVEVSVPPGQMRAFSSPKIYLEGMPTTSNPRWGYEITEIQAQAVF
jgi:hypothetical protein